MAHPNTTQQWRIQATTGFDCLKLEKGIPLPQLGDHDCLVQIKAVSLNYRDLIIPQGKYPFPINCPLVPGSDGAGVVVAVGPRVTEFKTGDEVCTQFTQSHQGGSLNPKDLATALGGARDGTLSEFAVFEETGLVRKPKNLSFNEAATLTCAGLTAWNALYGLKPLKPGDWVLTQGTGGVSIFALQFAVAAGAKVVATTGSDAKAETLKRLGASHVINYNTDKNWGKKAKALTSDGLGFHHILEVGGPVSFQQSLDAIKIDGVISIIGFVGGVEADASDNSFLKTLTSIATVRGILVGSRQMFKEMNEAIEAKDVHPLVDEKVFNFTQVREAYEYMWAQKHVGKLVITLP